MDLTIKKLIEILINEKKFLIIFFLSSILFYPIYFYTKLNDDKVFIRVDTMYNYSIPNSISSLLSDTFINLLKTKIEENYFLDKGLKCNVNVNESTKNKTFECLSAKNNKDVNFTEFKILIHEVYSNHIENLYQSIKYSPTIFIDSRLGNNEGVFNDQILIFLKKEKNLRFYLNIEKKDRQARFNFVHYILSFMLIFFLNIFRVILKN